MDDDVQSREIGTTSRTENEATGPWKATKIDHVRSMGQEVWDEKREWWTNLLTDFELPLNTSFTTFSMFNFSISIGIHDIDKFPRESSMLKNKKNPSSKRKHLLCTESHDGNTSNQSRGSRTTRLHRIKSEVRNQSIDRWIRVLPVPFQSATVLEFLMRRFGVDLDLVPFLKRKQEDNIDHGVDKNNIHRTGDKLNKTTSRHGLSEQHLSFSDPKVGCPPSTVALLLF